MLSEVKKIVDVIREKTDFVPLVALTLGSGLGNFAQELEVECEISYRDLPGFPVSTAPGHDGKFVFGRIGNVPVVCMKGRVHMYEGYTPQQVVMPLRVMQGLGAKILFLTYGCGGIKSTYHVGTLALLTDHISSFVPNPLIGPNDDEEGVRFPDMTHAYDLDLQKLIREVAEEDGIELDSGVYVQTTGPSFESPAEIRMFKTLGADLVGMSTVVEAIVGVHTGMKVCCISMVANFAAGILDTPITENDVFEAGQAAAPKFTKLVKDSIVKMGEVYGA